MDIPHVYNEHVQFYLLVAAPLCHPKMTNNFQNFSPCHFKHVRHDMVVGGVRACAFDSVTQALNRISALHNPNKGNSY